jgi:hypothetical protein
LFGVAAGAFGPGRFERDFNEGCADAFHLFLHGGADIVGVDHSAEPLRSGDRLQTGNAGADHEHFCWRERAGGRHHEREHFRQTIGSEQDGFVTGDRGHRRQHVHALRAGDARDEFHGEQRDAAFGQLANGFDVAKRITRGAEHLAVAHVLQIRDAGVGIRAEATDLQEDVGRMQDLPAVVDHFGAGVGVGIVRETGGEACLGFNLHAETAFD